MGDSIVISGTDPTNPRNMGHIVERLEQIKRDTAAMAAEAQRLSAFVESCRDVLLDQGVRERAAVEQTSVIRREVDRLGKQLIAASVTCMHGIDAITDSKVNLKARFTWRPTWQKQGA